MKKATVKYLLSLKEGEERFHTRYLIENEKDLQTAINENLIIWIQIEPIRNAIAKEPVVLNEKGGWCNLGNVWEIIHILTPTEDKLLTALNDVLSSTGWHHINDQALDNALAVLNDIKGTDYKRTKHEETQNEKFHGIS